MTTYTVSQETLNKLEVMKQSGTLFTRYADWYKGSNTEKESDYESTFNELMYLSEEAVSSILTRYLGGSVFFKEKDPEDSYLIILKGINYDHNNVHWCYIALEPDEDGDPIIKHTDDKNNITTFTKAQFERLPQWAQALGEKVED